MEMIGNMGNASGKARLCTGAQPCQRRAAALGQYGRLAIDGSHSANWHAAINIPIRTVLHGSTTGFKLIALFVVTLAANSERSQFVLTPFPGLPNISYTTLSWGDYDHDDRLDFLIGGRTAGHTVSQLRKKSGFLSNSPPAAPECLSVNVSGTSTVLRWNYPADDHMPAAALTYEVGIGTTSGASDTVSPKADPDTGLRRVATLGNLGESLWAPFRLPPGNYCRNVQSVDSGFIGSPFAAEQQFSNGPPLINLVRHDDVVFEFGFTTK